MKQPTLIAIMAAAAASAVATSAADAAGGFGTYGPPELVQRNFVRTIDNPYFPLKPGMRWVYTRVKDGKPVRDVVEVTRKTKKIGGVKATVVRDRLFQTKNNKLAETTIDWYAQDKRGDVV